MKVLKLKKINNLYKTQKLNENLIFEFLCCNFKEYIKSKKLTK